MLHFCKAWAHFNSPNTVGQTNVVTYLEKSQLSGGAALLSSPQVDKWRRKQVASAFTRAAVRLRVDKKSDSVYDLISAFMTTAWSDWVTVEKGK